MITLLTPIKIHRIQKRLRKCGWKSREILFPKEKQSAWDRLTLKPKPLTDRCVYFGSSVYLILMVEF